MASVLIIDDDKGMCFTLSAMVQEQGHDVTCAYTLESGFKEAGLKDYDLIFLDVQLPDGNGLDVLAEIQNQPSQPEIIIITGQGDPNGAELAIKKGAWDYIEKPSSIKEMTLPFIRAIQYHDKKQSLKAVKALNRAGIIGSSPQINGCLDLLAQAASTDTNVLIMGQTGTGKELFARAVHNNSSRINRNFVVVDCTALTETLLESILFGHEKGAFTGAVKSQDGLIRQADGGTLFLDEVSELPMSIQKTFLRLLQERSFRPVGSEKEVKVDFRLVAATNRNLDSMVNSKQFRQDLLFRLRSFTITLPPLKDHKKDITELVLYHVAKIYNKFGMEIKGISPELIETLIAYDWPGNVRELVGSLERSISAAKYEPVLVPRHLPEHIRIKVAQTALGRNALPPNSHSKAPVSSGNISNLQDFLEDAKQQYFQKLMAHTANNIQKACRISGISRSGLYEHLKKYKILNSR